MRDIFDVTDVSDLPEELRAQLPAKRSNVFKQELVGLLQKAGRPLRIDEIMAGFYRVHNKTHDKHKLSSRLFSMVKAKNAVIETVDGKSWLYKLK